MADNSKNAVSLDEQLRLAQVLLHHYETFHPFLELQLTKYTIACCGIALPGEVKFDVGSKTIIFYIRTEKKFKFKDGKVTPVSKSKVTAAEYTKQKAIAKMNLDDWTKKLLWGEGTTVRVYIDGTEL